MIPEVMLIALKRMVTAWPAGVSAVCLFVYLSTPSVMRLKVDPPAQFFDTRPEWSAERQEKEEWLAWAYWRRAGAYVQWRYEFGEKLPVDPPLEFRIEEKELPSSGFADAAAASRVRYWRKLRQVWNQPQTWDRTYQWDTQWVEGSLVWLRGALGDLLVDVLGRSVPGR